MRTMAFLQLRNQRIRYRQDEAGSLRSSTPMSKDHHEAQDHFTIRTIIATFLASAISQGLEVAHVAELSLQKTS